MKYFCTFYFTEGDQRRGAKKYDIFSTFCAYCNGFTCYFLFPELTRAETYYDYKDSKLLNIYSKDNGKFYKATFTYDKNGNITDKKNGPRQRD